MTEINGIRVGEEQSLASVHLVRVLPPHGFLHKFASSHALSVPLFSAGKWGPHCHVHMLWARHGNAPLL